MLATRRLVLPLVCLALAAIVGAAAIVDHRWKRARIDRAEVAEWYCSHEGTRCGGASSERIESRWQARQWGYEIAVAGLGGVAIVLGGRRLIAA